MKPIYYYLIGFVVIIIALVILTPGNEESNSVPQITDNSSVPNDAVHKGMAPTNAPSSSNLKAEIIQKMENLKKKVEENPSDTLAMREYADLISAGHKQDEALELYNRILSVNPNRVDILSRLTFMYYNLGKISESESYNSRILKIEPENYFANYNVGAISIEKGDTAKAKNVWQGLVSKYPGSKVAEYAQQALNRLNKMK